MGDCEYYQRRQDDFGVRHRGCAHRPPDYYLGYGKKYCVRFSTVLAPTLSAPGKAWLARARSNLQVAMEGGLARAPAIELDGPAFRKFAFGTHADAYWNAGLHDLPLGDKARVAATPDAKEWLSGATWQQAGDVAARDAGAYASDAGHGAKQVAADVVQYFRDLFK